MPISVLLSVASTWRDYFISVAPLPVALAVLPMRVHTRDETWLTRNGVCVPNDEWVALKEKHHRVESWLCEANVHVTASRHKMHKPVTWKFDSQEMPRFVWKLSDVQRFEEKVFRWEKVFRGVDSLFRTNFEKVRLCENKELYCVTVDHFCKWLIVFRCFVIFSIWWYIESSATIRWRIREK